MNLVERVKGIILAPNAEWPAIQREPGDVAFLFINYVAILAAIPAVCGFVGWQFAGVHFGAALFMAVTRYVLSFVTVYILALIVDGLATTFGGQQHFGNALKLTVYSATSFWLAGIFLLVPALAFLMIVGSLYSIYLLWTGIPPLMRAPADRAVFYTVTVVLCMLVIAIVFGVLMSLVVGFRAFS